MKEERVIRIGTRESRLAMWQAEYVARQIRTSHPEIKVELVPMTTTGDKILHRALDQVGGKGLFVKELDLALREKRTDLSVHSLKDVPIDENVVVFGEIGLAGEIRAVSQAQLRVNEAVRLGFTKIILPYHNLKAVKCDGAELIGVKNIRQAFEAVSI